MDFLTITSESTFAVEAERMFKAFALDALNLIPKLFFHAIKKFELVEGNGGPGSIVNITVVEDGKIKYLKHRVDAIDKENLTYCYTVIEGDGYELKKVDSISHEIKFEPNGKGGCKIKNVSKYYPKAGVDIKEEDFEAEKMDALALVKVAEAYLLANPEAYA